MGRTQAGVRSFSPAARVRALEHVVTTVRAQQKSRALTTIGFVCVCFFVRARDLLRYQRHKVVATDPCCLEVPCGQIGAHDDLAEILE